MMRFLEKAREYWVHDGSIRGIAILNRIRHFDNMPMIRVKRKERSNRMWLPLDCDALTSLDAVHTFVYKDATRQCNRKNMQEDGSELL